jgi:hypothetical protein
LGEGVGFRRRGSDGQLGLIPCPRGSPGQRRKEHLTGGATPSVKRRGAMTYPFGEEGSWVVGPFLDRARIGPAASFTFFCSFLFPFSVFYFFCIFLNSFKSIQTKGDNFIKFKTTF